MKKEFELIAKENGRPCESMNIFNLRNQLLNDSASVMKSRWTYTSPSKADGLTKTGNQLPGRTDASGVYFRNLCLFACGSHWGK